MDKFFIASLILVFGLFIVRVIHDYFRTTHPTKESKAKKETVLHQEQILKGLDLEILEPGEGPGAVVGREIICTYEARLVSTGQLVDSSDLHGGPFTFKLGKGQVIAGWEKGLKGVKVGEKRRLTMESKHAYGGQGAGKIPPNEDLIFEIKVIKIR